ncbi:YfhE family protein [Terrilactibacillus sp. BCM23-1]|uniref:YfhE family protein n=1 Tax=Terrilactibacillus tamarindi TaxID=2599694 RepID=A0A6N8CP43_9BACI|nr:YfhE family protein [Terrilactibacillus tamarindi]MTT30635.1 YfhE family protein [Terrilactibacillus tamarindi]
MKKSKEEMLRHSLSSMQEVKYIRDFKRADKASRVKDKG